MQPKLAFTVSNLVEVGPLGRSKICSLIRDGILPAKKAGSRTVVLREDYENFLRSLPPVTPGAPAKASDHS